MFCHSLALRLGMTVGELAERISLDELNDWAAFFHLEQGGGQSVDDQIRAAFGKRKT